MSPRWCGSKVARVTQPLLVNAACAVFIWPPLGIGMGLFLALASRERSILAIGSYLVAGLLGTFVGGGVTYIFTYERARLGGFWTSIVTSLLGGLVFLGLWKAWLDANRLSHPPRT